MTIIKWMVSSKRHIKIHSGHLNSLLTLILKVTSTLTIGISNPESRPSYNHEMEETAVLSSMEMPRRPITFVPAHAGEILKMGGGKCRIMEDGSRTGEFTLKLEMSTP
jgi:hypothetical protein